MPSPVPRSVPKADPAAPVWAHWLRKCPPELLRIARFVIVGGANTLLIWAFYYATLALTRQAADPAWQAHGWLLAALVSGAVGIAFGFKAHGKVVFGHKGLFWRYVAVVLLVQLAGIGFMALIRPWVSDWLTPIATLPLTTVLSYLLMKYFVFIDLKGSS